MKPNRTLFIWIISSCIYPSLLACEVLLLGDSISSGYGITTEKTWANLLESQIKSLGASLVNLSVSGYTSRSGLELLKTYLKNKKPNIVIIELGGNDALQYISLEEFHHNLFSIEALSKQHEFELVVLGIKLPPNMPLAYRKQHHQVYMDLLKTHLGTENLLEYVIQEDLFQTDQIHPNNQAQPLIFKKAWPFIHKALDRRCHLDSQ